MKAPSAENPELPKYSLAKPAVGHAKPAVGHAKPAVGHAKLAVGHAKPAVGHAKPAVGHDKPVGGQTITSHPSPAKRDSAFVISFCLVSSFIFILSQISSTIAWYVT